MPIQHAVLALLANGPSYGYSLKGAFEAAVGPQWGPLNIGHLYQVLNRLSRDDLVASEQVSQSVKPDRVVYEITDAGRAELAEWLTAPTPRTSGFRDDFFLKVMAAARGGDPDLLKSVITTQRTYLLRELRNLETLRRRPDTDRVASLLITAATHHVNADLTVLDQAEEDLPTLASPTLPYGESNAPDPRVQRSGTASPTLPTRESDLRLGEHG